MSFNKKKIILISALVVVLVVLSVIFIGILKAKTCIFGHQYSVASCQKPKTCEKCSDVLGAVVPHNYLRTDYTAPTCLDSGHAKYECSMCAHSYEEDVGATGHSYTSQEEMGATCTTDGSMVYTCKACNDSYSEIIPKLGHTTKAGQCERCGGYIAPIDYKKSFKLYDYYSYSGALRSVIDISSFNITNVTLSGTNSYKIAFEITGVVSGYDYMDFDAKCYNAQGTLVKSCSIFEKVADGEKFQTSEYMYIPSDTVRIEFVTE